MLNLGGHRAVRLRVGCTDAVCVARRPRRGLFASHLPLRRRLLLEAKRVGRSTAAGADDGDERPADGSRRAEDPADSLSYWEAQVAAMAFREIQVQLRDRGLSAGGRKDEIAGRLAEALLSEHHEAAGGGEVAAAAEDGEEPYDEAEGEAQEADLTEALLDWLDEMSYNDLRRMCSDRGLGTAGKKAELQERLATALLESGEDLEGLLGLGGKEAPGREEVTRARGDRGPSAAAPSAAADPASLLPELLPLKVSELVSLLREYGASTQGTKQELAMRLAECMVAEVKEEIGQGAEEDEEAEEQYDEGGEYDEAEEVYEEEEELSEAVLNFDPADVSQADRKLLMAAEARRLFPEHQGKTRAQLFNTLKQLRRNPSYQSRVVLLDQLVRTQAEERVEAALQEAQSDPAAARSLALRLEQLRRAPSTSGFSPLDGPGGEEGGAEGGVVDYSQLTPVDVRRMRVEDLRVALRHFGMDSSGNKYDMQERLMARVVAMQSAEAHPRRGRPAWVGGAAGGAAAGQGSAAAAAAAAEAAVTEQRIAMVLGMTLRTLREELDKRNLPTGGSRNELQSRLIAALRQEAEDARALSAEVVDAAAVAGGEVSAGGEGAEGAPEGGEADEAMSEAEQVARHLAALAELPVEERGAAVVAELNSAPEKLITLGREPPVDVAVVAGCPPGRLDLAQSALDAARSLLDQLYTAHMTSPLDHYIRPHHLRTPPTGEEEEQAAGGDQAAAAAATSAAADGEEEEAQPEIDASLSYSPIPGGVPRPPHGVVVSIWWLDGATGQSTLLSPAQVYAATAAELTAGCLPAVHRELLVVPPPSPLSLDMPSLPGPVPVTAEVPEAALTAAGGGGGPAAPGSFFPDVASLAAHLRGTAHVVFPAVPTGMPLYGELQRALEAAGVPAVGSGAEEAALAHDRLGVLQRLESLSYPVVPQLELGISDVVAVVREAAAAASEQSDGAEGPDGSVVVASVAAALQDRVAAWCRQQELDPERQLFILRPRHSSGGGTGLPLAAESGVALGAARVAEVLAGPLTAAVLQAEEEGVVEALADSVMVEPLPTSSAARFVCTVVETPDGPVALLPSEVELYDTEVEILKHGADVAEWVALREGADDAQVAAARADVLAAEPEPTRAAYDPRVTLPATTTAHLHTPPRFSRKLTHAVRHSAARLFIELGLRDVATVEGWVELPADYVTALEDSAGGRGEDMDDVPTLYDTDPIILAKIAKQEAERIAADPAPLEAYYDCGRSWHADLSEFDPATRLNAATNGERATVRIAGVAADLPLDARHPAVLQAAEVGLPHATLLRNLANNALRRAAAAGDKRALVPTEPYTSPDVALHAAALEAMAAAVEEPAAAEEWGVLVEEEEGQEGPELDPSDLKFTSEAEEEAEEERLGQVAEAAAAAEAEPVECGPAPLQLPMPPQLPLYHTAVMQHQREADEYDTWVEDMDPDHWDDSAGPERVEMMCNEMEQQIEEATGLPRGYGDDPNPVAADMVSAITLEGHRMALDAAVEALGEFGSTLKELMTSMPLEEALEADASIPLTRVKELPDPDDRLPDGVQDTAGDPRVVAAWQMAAICELARRHGWEALEVADAAEEEAVAAAQREADGIPEPTPEEEEAAAAAEAEEQAVLEGMCANDDEVMELRTGLITPVQIYLRFRERQARAAPRSHPLAIAGEAVRLADSKGQGADAGAAGSSGDEAEEALDQGEVLEELFEENEEGEEGEEEEFAGGTRLVLPTQEGDAPAEPGSVAAAAAEVAASFGPASSGPGLDSPAAYTWNVPPDDAVELPVYASAGLTAAAMAVGAAVEGSQGSLARQVAASTGEKLSAEELEVLAMMDLGFEATPVDVDPETGLPVLAAIGPSLDGLHQELILDPFSGGLSQLPSFRPLAAIMQADGVEPATSAPDGFDDGDEDEAGEGEAVGQVNWDEEDGFARGVARASAAVASAARRARVVRAADAAGADVGLITEADVEVSEPGDVDDDAVAEAAEGGGEEEDLEDEAAAADLLEDLYGDDEEDLEPGEYASPTIPLVDEALARGDIEGAELAALVPPMNPTRVWVVVGGDGHWGREAGLAAGNNVIAKLAKYQDLVVEPFLLVPLGEGRNTELRRAELLSRRTEFIAGLGMDPEEDLPESMAVEQLRVAPPMPTGRPETQCMYAVTLATVARPSVPEALSSLERTAAREGVALHSLSELQRQQRVAHMDVQAELAAAGMEGVASLWDDNVLGQPGPPPARPLDLESFAEDAQRAGAVVLVAARGEMAESGGLQTLLELHGVPCVGPGSQQLSWMWNRLEAAEMLQDLHDQGVDAPPRFLLTYDEAVTAADLDEQDAEELMDRIRSEVVDDPPEGIPLLVRPVSEVGATGVARLTTGADIVAYMTALRDGDATLPADTLSYPHAEIRLPPRPPSVLAFELFVETDPLFMVLTSGSGTSDGAAPTRGSVGKKRAAPAATPAATAAPSGAALLCPREKGWVEVSFTLMGPLGAMSCLPPAMRGTMVSESDLAAAREIDARTAEERATATKAAEAAAAAADSAAQAALSAEEGGDDTAAEAAAEAAAQAVQRLAELPPAGVATAALRTHAPQTWVVPPPEAAVSAAALDEACKRAALIADRLGLRGLVQIEAFVAADSGELAVYDMNGNPDLGPDSAIWRQAAAAGLLPSDFIRELLGLAIDASASPEGRAATFEAQLDALEQEGWDLDEDETYDSRYDNMDEEEGELRLRGSDEEDDLESEGGQGGLSGGEAEEYDMLGQLEELRSGAGAAAEEDDAGDAGAVTSSAGPGDEGFLYFDDEEEDGGRGAAAGGVGGGFMGLDEFRGGRGGKGGRGFDDDDF